MEVNKAQKQYFTQKLMQWHAQDNDRSLPWKEETDPYKIWLSEVILQQTRAEQGLPYYLSFTEAYPTIQEMAEASDEDVYRIWQGLGYYNRCRNMLATARYVSNELKGVFPNTYDDILALKGVGPYTAAAIASFAYGLPHAVVDGNVYRVLSRYFGIDTAIDTTVGKKEFTDLANELLDTRDSAGYNQAIMDIGATVCKPAAPLCNDCPLQKKCVAYTNEELIKLLPVKSKKVKVATRYFHYIIFMHNNSIWIHQRTGKDIWSGLYEPYLIEHTSELDRKDLVKLKPLNEMVISKNDLEFEGELSQRLTHRIIKSRFFSVKVSAEQKRYFTGGKWVKKAELQKLAYPKTIVSLFEKKSYFY
ncbi:MAG: A/G-specific adenine glycosylase [Chitinophagales bacterium]|nr:A/G-specific adenine glycosylase [Chitinophagales bacterium]